MDPKTCQICSSRPARLVLLRRKLDDVNRTFVCSECAAERARLYANCSIDLRRLGKGQEEMPAWAANSIRCEKCGADLSDAGPDVQPGCCECYVWFADVLKNAVRAVQGSVGHLGKTPLR